MARKQSIADEVIGADSPGTPIGEKTPDLGLCPRCSGLMVRERFEDFPGEFAGLNFQGVRCVNCGEILDSLILAHRTHGPNQLKSPNNRRHFQRQV